MRFWIKIVEDRLGVSLYDDAELLRSSQSAEAAVPPSFSCAKVE